MEDKYNPFHTLANPPVYIYEQLNTDAAITADGTQQTTLTLSAASGGAIVATAGSAVFNTGMVGGLIKVNDAPASLNGIAKIVAFISSTKVTLDNTVTYQGQAFASLSYVAGTWGIAQSTYSGLSYLNGMTVDVVGDGAVGAATTVIGGQVTLQSPAIQVEVGLHYDSTAILLSPDTQLKNGSTIGRFKKWSILVVRMLNTLGLTMGLQRAAADPVQSLDEIAFRMMGPTGPPPTNPPPLFSGFRIHTQIGIDRDGKLVFKQTRPLPCTVTTVVGQLEIADEV